MVKVPVAGRVKTRLARGIGTAPATSFYRHATAALSSRLNRPHRWSLTLAVAPDALIASAALPVRTRRIPQGPGDLGDKLQRVFDRLPAGPVIVIGSDVTGITPTDIADAFRTLEGHDAVLGPSPDGGYWLIGLRRRPRRLKPFKNVRWSTDAAQTDTLRNLYANRVGVIRERADIDDAKDWQANRAGHGRRVLAPD